MIQLRGMDDDKEMVEVAKGTVCHLIDGLHYTDTKEVRRIGAKTTLQELRAFEIVEIDTGFDDDAQPRIMAIMPKRGNGVAALVASLAMMLLSGCGSGATYHYSYTCYGNGCAPPPMFGVMYPRLLPQQARVVYVNRPVELRVHSDGASEIQRRAATPRRRAQ